MSIARLRDLGIRPDRDLGQNFLADPNILDVIAREAELAPTDVVLEIGGGLGVLSERLAAQTAHVHVVEVDPRLGPVLRDVLAPYGNATLHVDDALALSFAALAPEPVKLVANLPYGIAATAILKALEELPHLTLVVAMVQREVGERLAAAPGTPAYGLPSVLAQIGAEVKVVRAISRTVFTPVPNVDSVLVRLRPLGPSTPAAAPPAVRALAAAGFAHRRKALAGSLALAPGAAKDVRERARAALTALGFPADARAERLGAQDWVALAEKMEA